MRGAEDSSGWAPRVKTCEPNLTSAVPRITSAIYMAHTAGRCYRAITLYCRFI